MGGFPTWFWALVTIAMLLNVRYIWRLIGMPRRVKHWLEAQGWVIESVIPIRRDTRWHESDRWWSLVAVAIDSHGNKHKLHVRVGRLWEQISIVHSELLAQPEGDVNV